MKQRSNASASIVKFGVSQIKVYPSREQKALLFKTFGANRWFWNQIKSMTDQRYQNNPHLFFLSAGSLKILLPQLKKEHAWLKEVNSTSLQATADTTAMHRKLSLSKLQSAENRPSLNHAIIIFKQQPLKTLVIRLKV